MMKKILMIVILVALGCKLMGAKSATDNDKIKALEDKCIVLQAQQGRSNIELQKLTKTFKEYERKLEHANSVIDRQNTTIDSLLNTCRQLAEVQSHDRKNVSCMIDKTNSKVQANQETLQSRTLWIVCMSMFLLIVIIGVAYKLAERIKSGDTSIDEVRKAQEALQVAQEKMQEESIKLDDKLLELFDRQIVNASKNVGNDQPDHSLALKVADEIVRIELNMSRMDSSVKGYKQLAKAVERIKDNFKANSYEIVDMLGKPYNEGMKVIANFVVDENLEEGKQIITGITKPQINYNGQMIQAAQITVSQNI